MWTIQEVTLSAIQRTFLRCGSIEIPWPVLVIAVNALKAVRYKWGQWDEAMKLQKQLVTYMMVRRFPGSKAILDDNPGKLHNDPLVFDILAGTRKKLAGDEKDKIFALYGLFSELEIQFPKPDYTLPVEDVYRQATIAAIEHDKSLHILYHVPSDKRRTSLASWVPDWAEEGLDPGDPRYGVLNDRLAASGPGTPLFRFSNDQKALVLRGKIIDTIIFKADPLPDATSIALKLRAGVPPEGMRDTYIQHNHTATNILWSWVDISTWAEYPTSEPTKDALQRTLHQDQSEENTRFTADGSFTRWYETMTRANIERLDAMSAFKLFGTNRFHLSVLLFCSRKTFFRTGKAYFGTAPDPLPDSMQAGDVIALVSGLELPLVLRPVDGGYRLITHVYVHGMMYGESWPERQEQLEDIVLV